MSLSRLDSVLSKVWCKRLGDVLKERMSTPMRGMGYRHVSASMLCQNTAIPLHWLLDRKEEYRLSWYDLAHHPEMTMDILMSHSEFDLHRHCALGNSNIPIEHVLMHAFAHPADVTPILSAHSGLRIEHLFMDEHQLMHGGYLGDLEELENMEPSSIRWNWHTLSMHENMTPDIIQTYSHLPWDPVKFMNNPSFTWKDVQEHVPEHVLSHYGSMYSMNPSVTMDYVLEHPEVPWKYKYLSLVPSLRVQDIRQHPTHPWDFQALSRNTFAPWTRTNYTKATSMRRMNQTHAQVDQFKDELMAVTGEFSYMAKHCLSSEEVEELKERWRFFTDDDM